MVNPYKIAVHIALTNGMSSVLAKLSKEILGINTKVKDIEKTFGKWSYAVGGTAAIMGGVAIFGGLFKVAKAGSEVNHELELMKIQGMQVTEIHEASAKAMQVSGAVLTSTYADNLRHIRELRYAFGDTPDATKYLEDVTKSNAVLNAVKGGGKDQVWELVKSLEQKGLTADPEAFSSYVSQMTKAVVASGGKVTPAQFFSAFKYGRTAMLGWNETFITQFLPRLIQSMSTGGGGGGSGGPGNALMSAFAKVVQGQMPKTAAEEFHRMGLTPGGIAHIKGSSQTQIVGGITGKDLFQQDPYAWVQQILMPALAKHGITSQNQIIEEISRMFPVRTASQIISEMGLQGSYQLGDQSPFEKDARLQREAFDQRMSYDELIKNDYDTMMGAFHAQWKTFNQVVGAPLSAPGGPLVRVLGAFTSLMNSASRLAQENPEVIEVVAAALAVLATAAVVAGLTAVGVALAGMVTIGPALVGVAAGITAIAVAFGLMKDEVHHDPSKSDVKERHKKTMGDPWEQIDKKIGKQSFIGNFNVDGRKLASIVFERGGRMAGGLPNSSSAPDYTDNLAVGFA